MDQQSIVYGCITDILYTSNGDLLQRHRHTNRQVMSALPSAEQWPLLSREMFSPPTDFNEFDQVITDVMHFGSAYRAIEYEWEQWLACFEAMLQRMYWVTATVHLETEFNGRHTFNWEAEEGFHEPSGAPLAMRCEWSREAIAI